jgi:hypothetical protein
MGFADLCNRCNDPRLFVAFRRACCKGSSVLVVKSTCIQELRGLTKCNVRRRSDAYYRLRKKFADRCLRVCGGVIVHAEKGRCRSQQPTITAKRWGQVMFSPSLLSLVKSLLLSKFNNPMQVDPVASRIPIRGQQLDASPM